MAKENVKDLHEYSEGVCYDGAAILCDGKAMTVSEILHKLRILDEVHAIIKDSPELNPSNYSHDDACKLNADVCEAWNLIEG